VSLKHRALNNIAQVDGKVHAEVVNANVREEARDG
jgi:hypothetical protein